MLSYAILALWLQFFGNGIVVRLAPTSDGSAGAVTKVPADGSVIITSGDKTASPDAGL